MPNARVSLSSQQKHIEPDGTPTKDFYNFLKSTDDFVNQKATVSRKNYDLGSITSGPVTISPSNGLKQSLTNNGAFTLQPSDEVGDVQLMVTNGASAGVITLSGFDKTWTGDSLDTTNGHRFVLFMYGYDGKQALLIRAMQ